MTNTTQPASKPANALQVLAPVSDAQRGILSDAALAFVADLERRFGTRRRELLAAR